MGDTPQVERLVGQARRAIFGARDWLTPLGPITVSQVEMALSEVDRAQEALRLAKKELKR